MAEVDWLIVGLARGLTGHQLGELLDRFGSPGALLSAGPWGQRACGVRPATVRQLNNPDRRLLDASLAWLETDGNRLITWSDDAYPPLLREIPDPPTVLFLRGAANALLLPQLAVVGSRKATPGGLDTARRFAAGLSDTGFAITSGLAHGIDAAGHRGALDAGAVTVAVFGTGPDRIYPASHRRLANSILERGALVTEFPPGTPVRASQFPQRNRLISGLSVGTLVVEAGTRSGALITARLAAEQGREVFAVPGSIHNPLARGCHRLIRNGAKLVESTTDIVEELGPLLAILHESIEQNKTRLPRSIKRPIEDSQYEQLLTSLGWDPLTVDDLVARSGLTAAEVSSMLLNLELEDRVRPLGGGRYQQREEGVHDERDRA